MRNWILLLLLLLCVPACRRALFEPVRREGTGSIRDREPELPAAENHPSLYATALVFPDTASWRAGSCAGARLRLWKNGVAVRDIPLGDNPDPGRHLFQDGHLWNSVTDGRTTTLSCDGTPFATFPGEESLHGFLVHKGKVHTLGQHPGGGVTYRVNGKAVFHHPEGLVVGWAADPHWKGGALYTDGGDVYYAFGFINGNFSGYDWDYSVMRDSTVCATCTSYAGSKLYDLRMRDGHAYRLARIYGRESVFEDNRYSVLGATGTQREVQFLEADGILMAKGCSEKGGWLENPFLGVYYPYEVSAGESVGNLFLDGGVLGVVVFGADESVVRLVQGDQETALPPGTYRLALPRCAGFREGIFGLALSAIEGNGHLLVNNGRSLKLSFNGYFTGVYIE